MTDYDDYDDYINAMAEAPRLLFSKTTKIKAGRLAHQCYACRSMIEPGQPKVRITIMTDMDAKPYTTYEHPSCSAKDGFR